MVFSINIGNIGIVDNIGNVGHIGNIGPDIGRYYRANFGCLKIWYDIADIISESADI